MLGNAFVYWVCWGLAPIYLIFPEDSKIRIEVPGSKTGRYEKVVFLFLYETVKLKIETFIAFSNQLHQLTTSMNTMNQYIWY